MKNLCLLSAPLCCLGLLGLMHCRPSTSGETAGDTETGDDTQNKDTAAPGWTLTIESPDSDQQFDECGEICFSAVLRLDGEPQAGVEAIIEVEDHGLVLDDETDEDGRVLACGTAIVPGTHSVAYTFYTDQGKLRQFTDVDIFPFGFAYGVEKPQEALTGVPWLPEFTKYPGNPVLDMGNTGEWDGAGIMLASVINDGSTYFMYYAGTRAADYEIGVATSPDGLNWTKYAGNPILGATGVAGSWRELATNSPVGLYEDGVYKVWYTGRAEEGGGQNIGLAESTNGLDFTDYAYNPVIVATESEWEGEAVAHPGIVHRGDIYELWYSTGKHKIGYAISVDGIEWEKYCGNPVMTGDSPGWENAEVKSAEMLYQDGLYYMAYSGGGSGAFKVGWAVSNDGLRWVKDEAPVISPGGTSWESTSTLGAALLLEDDTLKTWYSGTFSSGSKIGYADAPWPE